ncbi:MAG: RNA polymerase sigma factor [Acidobacteriota bacterium]
MIGSALHESVPIWSFDAPSKAAVPIVYLLFHPHDAVWNDRFLSRALGSVVVKSRAVDGASTLAAVIEEIGRDPEPVTSVWLLSPASVEIVDRSVLERDHLALGASLIGLVVRTSEATSLDLGAGDLSLAELEPMEVDRALDRLVQRLSSQGIGAPSRPVPTNEDRRRAWFSYLFREHYRALFAFFRRRGHQAESARDLVQDTMVRAYRSLDAYDFRRPIRRWIFTVAVNVDRNWHRDRRQAQKRAGREVEMPEEDRLEQPAVGPWRSADENPEHRSLALERQRRLGTGVDRLGEAQRAVLIRWLQGWKYREIAEDLEISLQTVRSTLHRAKARLREILAADGLDPDDHDPVGGIPRSQGDD